VEAGFMKMKTLYGMGGWLFGWACVAVVVGFLIFRKKAAGGSPGPEPSKKAKTRGKKKKKKK